MLTIKHEVKLVKDTPFSLATVLYLIIRYGFLFLTTTSIVLDLPVSVVLEQDMTTRCLKFLPTSLILFDHLSCSPAAHLYFVRPLRYKSQCMLRSLVRHRVKLAYLLSHIPLLSIRRPPYHGTMVKELVPWGIPFLPWTPKPDGYGNSLYFPLYI